MTSPHLRSTSQFIKIHFLSSVVIGLYTYVIKPFVPKKSKQILAGSRTIVTTDENTSKPFIVC